MNIRKTKRNAFQPPKCSEELGELYKILNSLNLTQSSGIQFIHHPFLMVVQTHSMPSLTPSPPTAEQGCVVVRLSRIRTGIATDLLSHSECKLQGDTSRCYPGFVDIKAKFTF